MLADDRILVGGFTLQDGSSSGNPFLVRLMPNGSPDPSFGVGGRLEPELGAPDSELLEFEVMPDGRTIALARAGSVGPWSVTRLLADGKVDPSYAAGGARSFDAALEALELQPDGSAVVAQEPRSIIRLTGAGEPDTSFSSGGGVELPDPVDQVRDIAIDGRGRILAVAGHTDGESLTVARLRSDGSLDPEFSGDGVQSVPYPYSDHLPSRSGGAGRVAAFPDDQVLLVGYFVYECSYILPGDFCYYPRAFNLDSEGEPTNVFGPTGLDLSGRFAIDPSGRIMDPEWARGRAADDPGAFVLSGFSFDGALDPAFGDNGRVVLNPSAGMDALGATDIQSSGAIVASGAVDERPMVARFGASEGPANLDADSKLDDADDCPAVFGEHRSGCPVTREPRALLRYREHRRERFFGYIRSRDRICRAGLGVSIMRRKKGADIQVGRAKGGSAVQFPGETPKHAHAFKLLEDARPGVYYARTRAHHLPLIGICPSTTSGEVRVR